MKQKKHIIFFSPTMQRTGSEIVLLNLLNHISDFFEASVISKYKGPLLHFIKNNIKTSYLYQKKSNDLLYRIIFRLKSIFIIPFILKNKKESSWYINTIVTPDILNFAIKYKVNVVLHVHELEQMFDLLNKEQLEQTIHYPDLIIANSEHTKQLIKQYGRTKSIELCYPAIDTKKNKSNRLIKENYRTQLNIPQDYFVWTMCGTLDLNKNPDLFIEIAAQLLKSKPNTIFLWIGRANDQDFFDSVKNKTIQKNISDKIYWIDCANEDYLNYFNCADGFVLTSNKESFSLVTIEALLLGIPVVTHDCGGVKEILRDDIGIIVKEKNNVQYFVDAMLLYMNNEMSHNITGGIERAMEFDIKIWSQKWNEILINYVK